MEEKKEIRKKIFKVRKEHTNAWIRENSLRITEALTQLPEYRNAERIMAYADYNHEVITRYIIEQAWKDGKEVAVPKVFGKDMVFYRPISVSWNPATSGSLSQRKTEKRFPGKKP